MRTTATIILCSLLLAFLPVKLRAHGHLYAFDRPAFQKLGVDQGLSQGSVNAITQDKYGFLWFGTNDGLNRHDGYVFETFRHMPGQQNSLSSSMVNALVMEEGGRLWMGTQRGLNSLDLESGQFRRWQDDLMPADIRVLSLSMDRRQTLWVATGEHGLFSLDTKTGETRRFSAENGRVPGLSKGEINTVFADSSNRIWVSTASRGLYILDPIRESFRLLECELIPGSGETARYASGIREDSQGRIWIISSGGDLVSVDAGSTEVKIHLASYAPGGGEYYFSDIAVQNDTVLWITAFFGHGLIRYDTQTGHAKAFSEGVEKHQLLMSSYRSVYVDRDGNVWAGSNGMGISLLPAEQRPFVSLSASPASDIRLPFSSMRGIYAESDQKVFLSGYYGFVRLDMTSGKAESLLEENLAVFSILRDKDDRDVFWLGTEGDGLFRMRLSDGSLSPVSGLADPHQHIHDAIVGEHVYSLLQAGDGSLLVGTDRGLNLHDPRRDTFRNFSHDAGDPASSPAGYIIALFRDSSGRIWVGTTLGGMAQFDKEKGTFQPFQCSEAPDGQRINRVNVFFEDSRGGFWAGTDQGLLRLDPDGGIIEGFTMSEGLPNNMIYGILEGPAGQLWLSTNKGLSSFDPQNGVFRNFTRLDGLPGNEFNTGSYFQTGPQRMFFGGVEGLVAFDPFLINPCSWMAEPAITRIRTSDGDQAHSTIFNNQEAISWEKGVQMMSLSFSGLNYPGSGKSKYAYRVRGLSDQWIRIDDQRQITLTRPKPGTYEFSIRATNSDGVWGDKPLEFTLQVLPMFHETRLFRLMMILLLAAAIGIVYFVRLKAVYRQRRKLALMVRSQTKELSLSNKALRESNEAKDKFFSIIAHDLKNPFNALLGFSELLDDQWDELPDQQKRHFTRTIRNTAESTYQLLQNLLDWSLIHREQARCEPDTHQPASLIREVLPQLTAQCEMKQVELRQEVPENIPAVWADADMVHTILRNLISNAVKFSHKGGKVVISAEKDGEDKVRFCIRDTGVGIEPSHLAEIFSSKDTGTKRGTRQEAGTGLGLMLCAEFVKRNGGRIWAESQEGEGSTFCFTLPGASLSQDS